MDMDMDLDLDLDMDMDMKIRMNPDGNYLDMDISISSAIGGRDCDRRLQDTSKPNPLSPQSCPSQPKKKLGGWGPKKGFGSLYLPRSVWPAI